MLTFLRLLMPDLLTEKLGLLSIGQAHAVARWAGIYEGLHTFMHGMCPCQVDLDPGEDDLP